MGFLHNALLYAWGTEVQTEWYPCHQPESLWHRGKFNSCLSLEQKEQFPHNALLLYLICLMSIGLIQVNFLHLVCFYLHIPWSSHPAAHFGCCYLSLSTFSPSSTHCSSLAEDKQPSISESFHIWLGNLFPLLNFHTGSCLSSLIHRQLCQWSGLLYSILRILCNNK